MSQPPQQQQQQPKFRLSSVLQEHTDQVRCVAPLPALHHGIVTCSFDRTVRSWQEKSDTEWEKHQMQIMSLGGRSMLPPDQIQNESRFELVGTFVGHAGLIIDVQYLPSELGADVSPGLIISASHDKSIIFWKLDGTVHRKIENAHEAPVSCLAIAPSGAVITGSWDKTAKVWNPRTGEMIAHLKGHDMNVLCVLGLPNGDIVTGCGDGTMKLWRDGMQVRAIIAHSSCVRGLELLPGVGFLSSSNDGSVKLWTFEGDETHVLNAHNTLVYSVAVNQSTGELMTCSEDNTVKIWKDFRCVQTIPHPNTVWRVCNLPNGDIVTACADCKTRVFTRDPNRVANEETLAHYAQLLEKSKKKVGGMNISELPSIQALAQPGTKDGELKVINEEGSARAYSWNARLGQWDIIGDVVDGPSVGDSFAGKEMLNGKFYDHVFDIELDTGRAYKLGFNDGDNPYEVAQEFIHQHELSQYHLDTIAQFIVRNFEARTGAAAAAAQNANSASRYIDPWTARDNAGGSRAGGAAAASAPKKQETKFVDPWSQRGAPAAASAGPSSASSLQEREKQKHAKHFPRGYDLVEAVNVAGIAKKIREFNTELQSHGQALSSVDLHTFEDLITILGQPASGMSLGRKHFLILDALLKWPPAKVFPVLDLLRVVVLHDAAAEYYTVHHTTILQEVLNAGFGPLAGHNPILQMMSLRFISNMFKHEALRQVVIQAANNVLSVVVPVCEKSTEERVRNEYTRLLHNFMVFLASCPTEQHAAARTQMIERVKALYAQGQSHLSTESTYRLFCAVGTLIQNNQELQRAAKQAGIDQIVSKQLFAQDAVLAGVAHQLQVLLKNV